jgi:protein-tyrosine phosphatase
MQTLVDRIERGAALSRARHRHRSLLSTSLNAPRPIRSVLFLCLGNICRSPFADVAARARLPGVDIASAGFLRHDGRPSPPHVVSTAEALGFDLSSTRARRVTADEVAAAGLIVCMDVTHLTLMAAEFPDAMGKTTLLGLFETGGPAEMRDPYDLSPAATREVFEQMIKAIDAMARSTTLARD